MVSADPLVSDMFSTQALNRYSYVDNNPLTYTDPTGYLKLGNIFRVAVAIVATYVTAGWASSLYLAGFATPAWTAAVLSTANAIGAVVGGFVGGVIAGGSLQSGLFGAISGGAFFGVGSFVEGLNLSGAGEWLARTAAHGVAGGAMGALNGGDFRSGFLSAGFSAFAGPMIKGLELGFAGELTARSIVGGLGSKIGGGKFVNGAMTAAFAKMFNDCLHGKGCWATKESIELAAAGKWKELYQKDCSQGGAYACQALDVAENRGAAAKITNWRLENSLVDRGTIASPGRAGPIMESIRIDLAKSYVDYLINAGATENNPTLMSRQAVEMFHQDVFQRHGAGQVFGGSVVDNNFVAKMIVGDWCAGGCKP